MESQAGNQREAATAEAPTGEAADAATAKETVAEPVQGNGAAAPRNPSLRQAHPTFGTPSEGFAEVTAAPVIATDAASGKAEKVEMTVEEYAQQKPQAASQHEAAAAEASTEEAANATAVKEAKAVAARQAAEAKKKSSAFEKKLDAKKGRKCKCKLAAAELRPRKNGAADEERCRMAVQLARGARRIGAHCPAGHLFRFEANRLGKKCVACDQELVHAITVFCKGKLCESNSPLCHTRVLEGLPADMHQELQLVIDLGSDDDDAAAKLQEIEARTSACVA